MISTDGQHNVLLEDNAELRRRLEGKYYPDVEFREVALPGGHEGTAKIFKPQNLVPGRKYPLLIYPYGGPQGTQVSTNTFSWGGSPFSKWPVHLASNQDVVAMRFDQRGAGGKGYKFLFELNRRLGTYEIDDQITAALNISSVLNYIDATKIGIFGWSYGGYTTSAVLGRNSDVIKCGIAGAPVVSWKYYYTGYTERYNGICSDADNKAMYESGSVTNHVENMRGKQLYIIHGTGDDNVHFQNSIQLIQSLSEAQIPFKTGVYVDQNHGIPNPLQRRHMFMSMDAFLQENCGFR